MTLNQNPEQKARDNIDKLLLQAGWVVQNKNRINLDQGIGQAVREYQTDVGPADYVLFVGKKAVGVIEAKAEKFGHNITTVEEQTQAMPPLNSNGLTTKTPCRFCMKVRAYLPVLPIAATLNRARVKYLPFIILKP